MKTINAASQISAMMKKVPIAWTINEYQIYVTYARGSKK